MFISFFVKRKFQNFLGLKKKLIISSKYFYYRKMDIETNTIQTNEPNINEENPETFLKLQKILDEKQIKYTLMEVI